MPKKLLPSHHPVVGFFHYGPSDVEHATVYPLFMRQHRHNPHLPMLRHSPASAALLAMLNNEKQQDKASSQHTSYSMNEEAVVAPADEWVFVPETAKAFTLEQHRP